MKDNKTINKNVLCVLICLVISFVLEITVFQYSHYRSLGVRETVIAENVNISGFTEYDTQLFIMDGEVKNLAVSGVVMNGCESLKVRAELSDEGDRYLYPLSDLEINAAGSPDAFMNIYPYGKVHEIYAHFTISEGTESVHIERISVNVPVPLRFSLSRCFIIYLILLFVSASFFLNDDMAVCTRGSKPQFFCAAAFLMIVIFVALFLCRSNPKLVSGSYSHHAQYQELAKALKDGHVDLYFYQPDEDLKAAANPYDTSSLLAEGIPYRPDYAYYKGSYYVYFGILPEILLYYPCYVLTGRSLSNVNAAFVFYVLLAVSVFALVWEAALCFGRDRFPYHLYLGAP